MEEGAPGRLARLEVQTWVFLPPLPATHIQGWGQWEEARPTWSYDFSLIPPCPSPGLQGLNSLTALPRVTQLLIAFVSPVRMRFWLRRVGVWVSMECELR